MEQTLQEQIRQEQEALIAAPRRPYQALVQTLSNIFHPLLSLTYAALIVCFYTPLMVYGTPIKILFVGEVAFFTLVLPVLVITLLHVFHVIGHWALRDVRDRTIPFLTNFACYMACYLVLQRNVFIPTWVQMPYFASVMLTFVAWIVSFWWKISAHASGNSAAMTFYLILYYYLPDLVPLWLVFGMIIVTGAVCSTRLYLGRHTLAQIGAGALLGISTMLISAMIYF